MDGAFTNQITGLIRFSFPSSDGFSRLAPTPAERSAELYEAGRMEQRFRLLETLALPSLAAQTDQDFTAGVLIGRDLPEAYLNRLRAVIAPMPNLRLIALPPGGMHYAATRRALRQLDDGKSTHMTGFRLDDDDAMDRGFIARLRARAAAIVPANGLAEPLVIGCNRGLQLTLGPGGNRLEAVAERLPIGIGLAMVVPRGYPANIFRRNHRFLPQYYATFTDASMPAFLRTVHGGNDSTPFVSGSAEPLTPEAAEAVLTQHFPFPLATLMAL